MSSWAYFRKHWIKPDVYPLIGSMAAAVGVCGFALINKALDPSVTWNKSKRKAGVEEQLEGVDEIVPMWSSAKQNSVRIFGSGNPIRENNRSFTALPDPVTVKIGEEEEEEEENTEEDAVTEEAVAEEPVAEQPAVLEVVDEAAETINAAVDAAIQSAAAAAAEAPEAAASSVAENAVPADPVPEAESASADNASQ